MTEQSETVVAETENTEETVSVDGETAGDAVEVTAASTVATAAASETSEESVAEAPATEITAEAETEAQAEAEESSTAAATSTGEPVAEDTSVTTAATDATAPSVAEAETDGLGDDETLDEEGRVVKLLAVGQKVTGVVRRITDFGAFVDIGVGRDGLIHVSELSIRRVGKVSDVLQENEEVEAWIKKLDRSRNRISLTLVEPGTKTIRDLEKDELVNGTVTRILPYGAFVDIGIGRDALLHIREMSSGYVARPEDVVNVGDQIEARIIELSRRRQRVDLSIKGLRPEPEVELPPEAEAAEAVQSTEDEVVDEFADVEVLSPMELAFKRAMEAEGIEIDTSKRKRRKGKRGVSIQDEIIARTLGVSDN